MIWKSIAHHSKGSIGKLLRYMVEGMNDPEKDFMIARNLPTVDNIEQIEASFVENDKYRKKRSTISHYHSILSFSPSDRENITESMLYDLGQKYMQMRGENALSFCVPHYEKTHFHLHVVHSGSEYKSSKSLRLSDKEFAALPKNMEKYQLEHYPQLVNSIAYLDKELKQKKEVQRDRNTRTQKVYRMRQRQSDIITEKERLTETLKRAYNHAQSREEFYNLLRKMGLSLYKYRERIAGVMGRRKYRFKTLGVTKEKLKSLDRQQQRWREIERLSRDDGLEL